MALEQGQQWNMIVYWASNPFLVKFDIVCVEAGFFQILSHYIFHANNENVPKITYLGI